MRTPANNMFWVSLNAGRWVLSKSTSIFLGHLHLTWLERNLYISTIVKQYKLRFFICAPLGMKWFGPRWMQGGEFYSSLFKSYTSARENTGTMWVQPSVLLTSELRGFFSLCFDVRVTAKSDIHQWEANTLLHSLVANTACRVQEDRRNSRTRFVGL